MENEITCASEAPKKLTVGEEFVNWAEQYWRLKQNYEQKDTTEQGGESCPYDYVKTTFIQKIDGLIKDRMAL